MELAKKHTVGEEKGPHSEAIAISPKAWMSVRDADLIEQQVRTIAQSRDTFTILEWGSGASTLTFTDAISDSGCQYLWVALEHDRQFFEQTLEARLRAKSHTCIVKQTKGNPLPQPSIQIQRPAIVAWVFDCGELRPDLGRLVDREADLDEYVALPRSLGIKFDLIVIDGRKRRRCLLEAAQLLALDGIVLLHDAQRSHYHSGFYPYRTWIFLGDELWAGSLEDRDLEKLFPENAFTGSRVHQLTRAGKVAK